MTNFLFGCKQQQGLYTEQLHCLLTLSAAPSIYLARAPGSGTSIRTRVPGTQGFVALASLTSVPRLKNLRASLVPSTSESFCGRPPFPSFLLSAPLSKNVSTRASSWARYWGRSLCPAPRVLTQRPLIAVLVRRAQFS